MPKAFTSATADGPRALTHSEFKALLDGIPCRPPFALAVSGGGDSTALLILMARYAPGAVTALTVDHGLRPASGEEARTVAGWCRALGVEHRTLVWAGEKPKTNIQALAREARYHLMTQWCREHQVPTLLTAHNLEDQAETFVLRLGRGSGIDGLSAMAPAVDLDDPARGKSVRLVRPLLSVSRERLRQTLRAADHSWIDDPSNEDMKFARVRVRAMAPSLTELGLEADRLAQTAAHMARAREALEYYTADLRRVAVDVDPAGFATIRWQPVADAPKEIALRVLASVLRDIGGRPRPLRFERLERLMSALQAGESAGTATLAGCCVTVRSDDTVLVTRENRNLAGPIELAPGQSALWDGRFQLRLDARERPGSVAALGETGWRDIKDAVAAPIIERVPALARITAPAFRRDGRVIAVPALEFACEPVALRSVFVCSTGIAGAAGLCDKFV